MGFTTAAFIRGNTPELRKKLEELGYKDSSTVQDSYTAIYTDEEEGEFFTQYLSNITDDEIAVDCEVNEDLFFAIAALRDDTNENQWFTDGKDWAYHPKPSYCAPCVTIYKTLAFDHIPEEFKRESNHKATVEELIEHFRGKEE